MIPTLRDVAPVIECVIPSLYAALRAGLAYAEDQQPEPDDRDSYFWTTCARFEARNQLGLADGDGWALVPDVKSLGIHLRIGNLHAIRVLRSLQGGTPPPGRNKRRRSAYIQGQFPLADPEGDLPALSLIADWQDLDGEPIIHLGLPAGPWEFGRTARMYWRVPLPGDGLDLNSLVFDPLPDDGTAPVTLRVHPSEDVAQ
jgi:hypothetical protein